MYATLSSLAKSGDDAYIDSLPAEAEEAQIDVPKGADISDLIEIERTIQNNLVSELNERRADVAAGRLLDAALAEKSMANMVGIARARLLTLSAGFARLIAGQKRQDIVRILADEIEVITRELKPDLEVGVVELDAAVVEDEEEED